MVTNSLQLILKVGRDALIVALITVGLGELSLRIYNLVDPLPIFYSDSYNRFRGKPFAPNWESHLNSQGFNDVEFSAHKAAGTVRILGIVDSFAFGVVPYEYNYLTLLEKYLSQGRDNVELINMGIPNIGPREYLSLLVREGFALEPDKVLLSFFIGNDFQDAAPQRRSLVSYSYALSLGTYVLKRWSKFEGRIVHGEATYDDNAPTLTDNAYLELELSRSNLFLTTNQSFNVLLAAALSYIAEIKRLCDRRHIGLTIALIPDELQVSEPLQRGVIAKSGLSPTVFNFLLPNRQLRASLEELKIDYVDLITGMSAHSPGDRLYRRNDSHWNIAGNELAAQLIFQHLAQLMD